jgi:hypothetical protein
MTQSILARKNWEIFLIFLAAQFLSFVIIEALRSVFDVRPVDAGYSAVEFLIGVPVYLSYPVLVGLRLNKMLAGVAKFRITTPKVWIVRILVMTICYLLALFLIKDQFIYPILAMISIVCFVSVLSLPARPLKSIELRRNAGIWEYIPEAFQFVLWPLGIWWMQPRVNKIEKRTKIIIED